MRDTTELGDTKGRENGGCEIRKPPINGYEVITPELEGTAVAGACFARALDTRKGIKKALHGQAFTDNVQF